VTYLGLYIIMVVVGGLGVAACARNLLGAVGDYRASLRGGSPLKRSIAWAYLRSGIVTALTVLLLLAFAILILVVRLQGVASPLWRNIAVGLVVLAILVPTVGAMLAYRGRQRLKRLVEPPKG